MGVSALPVLERAAEEAAARFGHDAPARPWLKCGVGIAAGIKNLGYSFGFPEQSTASVEISPFGSMATPGKRAASSAAYGRDDPSAQQLNTFKRGQAAAMLS